MNSNQITGTTAMGIETGAKSKRKGVLIITALILLNILIVGFVLSWRL